MIATDNRNSAALLLLVLFALAAPSLCAQTVLTDGVPVNGNVAAGGNDLYKVTVPACATSMNIDVTWTGGDVADVLVKYNGPPIYGGPWVFDYAIGNADPNGEHMTLHLDTGLDVSMPKLQAGDWQILVHGYDGGAYTIVADYSTTEGDQTLAKGQALAGSISNADDGWYNGLAGAYTFDENDYYTFSIPSSSPQLTFDLTGLAADLNIYAKHGAPPVITTADYDANSTNTGTNSESITVNNPAGGTWYVVIDGANKAESAYTITANYTIPTLTDGVAANSTVAAGSDHLYQMTVPANATSMDINATFSGGDIVDVLVKYNGTPVYGGPWVFDYAIGNADSSAERMTIHLDTGRDIGMPPLQAGTWQILVHGYVGGAYTIVADYSTTEGEQTLTKGLSHNGAIQNADDGWYNGLAGTYTFDENDYYIFVVPSNATQLTFDLTGLSADLNTYAKHGSAPVISTADYDASATTAGAGNENITINSPAAGTWYVVVDGTAKAESSYSLTADYSIPALTDGVSVMGTAAAGEDHLYTIDVPANATSMDLKCTFSGGDIIDMLVSYEAIPAFGPPFTFHYAIGNADPSLEHMTLHRDTGLLVGMPPLQTGTWYILIHGFAGGAYSLTADYAETENGDAELTNAVDFSNAIANAQDGWYGNLAGTYAFDENDYYKITVPSGVAVAQFKLTGLSADLNLFARLGAPPVVSTAAYDWSAVNAGTSDETITLNSPTAGTYWLAVDGPGNSQGSYTIRASYSAQVVGTSPIPNATISVRGDDVVLVQNEPNTTLGSDRVVEVDLDANGSWDVTSRVEADGRYAIAFLKSAVGPSQQVNVRTRSADSLTFTQSFTHAIQDVTGFDPSDELLTDTSSLADQPSLCASGVDLETAGSSCNLYAGSRSPEVAGVELASGRLRTGFDVLTFVTRKLHFTWNLQYASLTDYDGPTGKSFSHSYNMFIVKDAGANTGAIVTPDLRRFTITSSDGVTWDLPEGFFARLTLDADSRRWQLVHHTGFTIQFYLGADGLPGFPLAITEPNGNANTCSYDFAGTLSAIETDLDQTVSFTYGSNGRIASVADHIGRDWLLAYDADGRLETLQTPSTQYVDLPPGQLVIDSNLSSMLVTRRRTTTLQYANGSYPDHITDVIDDRGAVPAQAEYDAAGRVSHRYINGNPIALDYAPTSSPVPLVTLDIGNITVRVTDGVGNITDYELHGPNGGPMGGGRHGTRRMVIWTETGKGNTALRQGEPSYWERRWLQDSDSLAPLKVTEYYRSDDVLTFDLDGIPLLYPTTILTYNDRHQVTDYQYTDGVNQIRWQRTYDVFEDFSRELTYTEPRAFSSKPMYAGLNFQHSFTYDSSGNRIRHDGPDVTRGVTTAQPIVTQWVYNTFGQLVRAIDPNGNITELEYFAGSSVGGNVNTKGSFGGYLKSTTTGAPGSADGTTALTTEFLVNALGMATQTTDASGRNWEAIFDNMLYQTRKVDPTVTLTNGQQRQYDSLQWFDGAGNLVLSQRVNLDEEGTLQLNAYIDMSFAYDAVGNVLQSRQESTEDDVKDLITRYAYDANDMQIVIQLPLGNRIFAVYDERNLPLREFFGVSAGATITESYPPDKTFTVLLGATSIGRKQWDFDARGNMVRFVDGRNKVSREYYDFADRRYSNRDQNGNGTVLEFDEAGLVLTEEHGLVNVTTGLMFSAEGRSYFRYDEMGRKYQAVVDGNLATDERTATSPAAIPPDCNPEALVEHDAGGRQVRAVDANGKVTAFAYDSAGRQTEVQDALTNKVTRTYDANSNLTEITVRDEPGPGSSCSTETYKATMEYDELNRLTCIHERGLNGTSIDHTRCFQYDSRHNEVLAEDEEAQVLRRRFDDANRLLAEETYADSTFVELLEKQEMQYDQNGNVVAFLAYPDVVEGEPQVTTSEYDDLDRLVAEEDPLGERWEYTYDEHYNVVQESNPRGIVFTRTFDDGNRLTEECNVQTPTGCGETCRKFTYDTRNRMTAAWNDYVNIAVTYDPVSRKLTETQTVNLDGTGHTTGFTDPIQLTFAYDCQGNRTDTTVAAVPNLNSLGAPDIHVQREFDDLNRIDLIRAEYFGGTIHDIADYTYCGRDRIDSKTLGNGAKLACIYDTKRRLAQQNWTDANNALLASMQYGYDNHDNQLHEVFGHDQNRADNYGYNRRYEVVGVNYRQPLATDYRAPGIVYADTFAYDNNVNRTSALYGDPFGLDSPAADTYTTGGANQYTEIVRGLVPFPIAHDQAGNTTGLLCRPAIGPSSGQDVAGTACYDAYNQLFEITAGANEPQRYLYDALGRRAIVMQAWGSPAVQARRFVWEDWMVVSERTLQAGTWELERVYVNGGSIDEVLLAAIDGDGDFALVTNLNDPVPPGTPNTNDYEYYFLNNHINSTMALLDAADSTRILEYYRYSIYGTAVVLPIVDANLNDHEDTPDDLDDNAALLATLRLTNPAFGRTSQFANQITFTARYSDDATGLLYLRSRHYDPMSGRFLSRDSARSPQANLYGYGKNAPTTGTDPFGKNFWKKLVKAVKKVVKSVWGGIKTGFHIAAATIVYTIGQLKGLLEFNSEQHLAYSTLFDYEDWSGQFIWNILWQLSGGPKLKRNQKDHWVVQKISWDNRNFNADGDEQTPESWEYLEAWRVKFVLQFLPQAFTNGGDLPSFVPHGDTWRHGESRSDAYGWVSLSGDAYWSQSSKPWSWSTLGPKLGGERIYPHHGNLRAVYNYHTDISGVRVPMSPTKFADHWRSITHSNRVSNNIRRHKKYDYFTREWESIPD